MLKGYLVHVSYNTSRILSVILSVDMRRIRSRRFYFNDHPLGFAHDDGSIYDLIGELR